MKMRFGLGLWLTLLALGGPLAQPSRGPDYVEICQKYAREDGVPADELTECVRQCVRDLSGLGLEPEPENLPPDAKDMPQSKAPPTR